MKIDRAFQLGCSDLFRSARTFFRKVTKDVRGAAAIEFGLMIPLLALIVVSVTDIGLGVYRKMQVENAAQAGAQYAMVHGFDQTAISNAVTNATNSTSISAAPNPSQFCGCPSTTGVGTASCGSTCSTGSVAGSYATVSAQATYSTLLNYQLVPSSYTFTAQSTARLQ